MARLAPDRSAWLLLALLILAGLACLPGLGAAFLFDDYPNLSGLSAVGADSSPYTWLQYLLNGVSSALGRPLSLLSFAAQSASWDQHPEDFLRVNLLLHLLNGALWFSFLVRLQRLGAIPDSRALPLLACALWLLLPVHASAVLYVVQRMTLLATSFVLTGLVLYASGRLAAGEGAEGTGYVRMSAGVAAATLLGTLSKETAAVAPMLLLALEGTVLRGVPRPARWRTWSGIFLWLPALSLLAWLVLQIPAFLEGYGTRTFTPGERLLTESRVLFMYLAHAFWPGTSVRLLYDDLAVSSTPFHPWTTALALLGWLAIAVVSVARGKRWPVFSLAVAWYLTGHLLESTLIPLELAFDHRSYLPLLGVCLGLAAGIVHVASHAAERLRRAIFAGVAVYLALLAGCLWLSASLWGRPLAQAREWVVRQPESHRAVHHYGRLLLNAQQPGTAAALYEGAARRWPDDAVIALSRFELGCFDPGIQPALPDVHRAVREYRGSDIARAAGLLQGIADRVTAGGCPSLRPDDVLAVLDTMLDSPWFVHMRATLHHSAALLLDATGRKPAALERLDQALALDPQVPMLQQAVLWSLQLGDTAQARAHLGTLETSTRIPPRQRWSHRKEIQGARQLIELYESLPGGPPP
jgi:tetratricopeptide (TPR) repeat protein